jgi:hypothetical protein
VRGDSAGTSDGGAVQAFATGAAPGVRADASGSTGAAMFLVAQNDPSPPINGQLWVDMSGDYWGVKGGVKVKLNP